MFDGRRFYFDSAVNQWLAGLCGKKGAIRYNEGESFMFELVDQPFCCIYSGHEDCISVCIYIRKELGITVELPDIAVTVYKDGRQPVIKSGPEIKGDGGQLGAIFLSAALVLRQLAEEHEASGTDIFVTVSSDGEEVMFEDFSE